MFSVRVELVIVLCGLAYSEASFILEFVSDEKLSNGKPADQVVLYTCGSSGSNTPNGQSADLTPRRRLGKMLSRGEPIACKRVDDKGERQSIYKANNFFLVKDPQPLKGVRLYDEKDGKPLQLPSTVNVGVEFDLRSFPKLEQTDDVEYERKLVAKLKFLHLLDYYCREELVDFLNISDIATVTRDSPQVVKQLNAFVTVLDDITQLYYDDYYRTFLLYVFKYDVNLAKKRRARSKLVSALNVILPKMIDPCFIMSFQTKGKKDADRFCTSYCRVLVVAGDILFYKEEKKANKECTVRWSKGVCRNDKCTCIKPTAGLNLFVARAPMHTCNNAVVQTNFVWMFRRLEHAPEYSPNFMSWVFYPKEITRGKDMCPYNPE